MPIPADTCGACRKFSRLLAEKAGLSKDEVFLAGVGGFLHDLGKIGVPDQILRKPGRLTEDEYAVVRTHPDVGRNLLAEHPSAPVALDAVAYHHERPDGRGYPEGLAGDAVPLMARIVAVADAFDAITSTRPYRRGQPVAKGLAILWEERGRQFDARLVDRFRDLEPRLAHVVGHSLPGRQLVTCPACGPILAVPRDFRAGGHVYCRACTATLVLHRRGDTYEAEVVGVGMRADEAAPQPDHEAVAQVMETL